MVQLQNFFFFIIFMVVLCGTAAPLVLKWFVSRDVSTGASFFNGTLIPILISLFSFLVYYHSRKFISSMDRAKSGVLVKASRPLLLPDQFGRSSSARNAFFSFVLLLHFLLLQSMGDLSYLESFCGLLCLQFFCTLFSLPRERSAKPEKKRRRKGQAKTKECMSSLHSFSSTGPSLVGVPPSIGLEALALPRSRLLMALGHDYYKKVKIPLPLSHGGVCIFILGVLLSNTKKIEFTQPFPLASQLHLGKEACSCRGIDHLHGPTFHSICGNFLISTQNTIRQTFLFQQRNELTKLLFNTNFTYSYEKTKLALFTHRWISHHKDRLSLFTIFPEKRYFFNTLDNNRTTTEVAIHTNLLTDLYATIGTGSATNGGWYTTIIKLPFIFAIWIGFLLAASGGYRTLLRLLKKQKLHWN